jgi:hypothetical protein
VKNSNHLYDDDEIQEDIARMQAQGRAEAGWFKDEVYQSYLTMGWAPCELLWIGIELYVCYRPWPDLKCTEITLAERSNYERP